MSQPQDENSTPFLDVNALLETSQPQARKGWLTPALAVLVLLILVSAYLSSRSPAMKMLVDVASELLMVVIVGAMSIVMFTTVRRHREERLRVEAIEELIQLRRWQQAAGMLRAALSRPALAVGSRVQLLLFLTTVLARYNRFDDAIAIHNYLLETIELDPAAAHAVHLGRAMAMLRQDHLVDADRAINDLRRDVNRAASATKAIDEANDAQIEPEPMISAGLALIEMYRDVKTGHPAEAIAMFDRALPAMRRQLGMRIGDAYALAAKACDFLDDSDRAQAHWERATLLSPAIELTRRYPELSALATKYRAADRPVDSQAEAA